MGKMGGKTGGKMMGGKHSTAHKAAHSTHGATGVHGTTGKHSTGGKKAMHATTGTIISPVSSPVPGGWELPTEPTERLRIPFPDIVPVDVEDPYSMMKMMGGKMGGKMGMMGGMMGGKMGGKMGSGKPKQGGSPTDMGTMMTTNGGSCKAFADANYLCATAACTSKVKPGSAQPSYQCAEFVARTLASTGKIPGLTSGSPQSAYGSFSYSGKTYDLLWTSKRTGGPLGLEDFLMAAGWKSGGSVQDCSVVFVNGATGPYGHVAVGVGSNKLDAHNNARLEVSTTYYTVNAVYNK